MANYTLYQYPGTFTYFLSEKPEHITNTLQFYRARDGILVPSEEVYEQVDDVVIRCDLPMLNINHYADAEVKEGIQLKVNANAKSLLEREISRDKRNRQRKDLFKFRACNDRIWLLSEDIYDSIRAYDWSQHYEQFEQWMLEREELLNFIEANGGIKRVGPNPKDN